MSLRNRQIMDETIRSDFKAGPIPKLTEEQLAEIGDKLKGSQEPSVEIVEEDGRFYEITDHPGDFHISYNRYGSQDKKEVPPPGVSFICPNSNCHCTEFTVIYNPTETSPKPSGRMGPQQAKVYRTTTINHYECNDCGLMFGHLRKFITTEGPKSS